MRRNNISNLNADIRQEDIKIKEASSQENLDAKVFAWTNDPHVKKQIMGPITTVPMRNIQLE
jgi:hypothetical protein